MPIGPSGFKGGRLVLIALFFSLSLGIAAFFHFQRQRHVLLEEEGQRLESVAALKVSQIVTWRKERFDDAQLLMEPLLGRYVRHCLERGAGVEEFSQLHIFGNLLRQGQYERILILDASQRVRYGFPAEASRQLDSTASRLVAQALSGTEVLVSDLCRNPNEARSHIYLAVPLCEAAGPARKAALEAGSPPNRACGGVLLEIDAQAVLFPTIQKLPTHSPAAETLLVRFEGERIDYLSSSQLTTNQAAFLNRSVQEPDLVAAKVGRGLGGVLLGSDYRGARVLAAVRPVPGTQWYLISKVDLAEVLTPLKESLRSFVLLAAVLVLAAILTMLLVWRNREYRFSLRELAAQRQLSQTLQQNSERLRSFTAATFEGIIISDDGYILEVNEQLVQMLGYPHEQVVGKYFEELVAEPSRPFVAELIRTGREANYESLFLRQDGSVLEVEVRGRNSNWEGRRVRITAVRDISPYKRQQHELERLNRLYRMLGKVNDAIVRARSRGELFELICRAAVDCGGFGMTWVGWLEPETAAVQPLAAAGDMQGYLEALNIALDGRPEGQGAVGTALTTGRPFVVNDFLAEPCLRPWHARARAKGFQAVGSFPLRFGGRVCGTLTVHAYEKNFFRAAEIELLQEVSVDISYALDRLQTEAERQRMEQALREGEAQLRQSQRVARVGSFVLDLCSRCWSSSVEADEILGIGPESARGPASVRGLIHPEDLPQVQRYMTHVLASKQTFRKDFRVRRFSDHQERWVCVLGELVLDGVGKPVKLQGVIQDITDRRQAEENIRSSRKRLLEIIESTPAGYFHVDIQRHIQHVNAAWLAMHGFASAEEVLGKPYGLTMPEAELAAAEAVTARVLAGETIQSGEMARKCKDGSIGYHSYSVSPVVADGKIIGLEGFLIDTTELRRAHELLRQREQHYRSLIENSSDIITIIRKDGIVTYQSPSVERIFGYELNDLLGRSILEMVHPDDRQGLARELNSIFETPGQVGSSLFRYKHKDGSWRVLESFGRRLSAPVNGQPALVANSRDVTERQQMAGQLRQAQKMDALGQLVSGVSHDFNNILTAVLIHLGLLKADSSISDKVKESLGDLERETLRATSLTRQLLLFSRQKVAEVQPLEMDGVVKNLAKMLRRVLGEHVELVLQDSAGAAWVRADAGMMEQVVMNLCINARDAMPQGGKLVVRTARVQWPRDPGKPNAPAQAGEFVCLSVCDTGCGMSPEVQERIFEPFFTTKAEGKGTGLGLATVYGIVKQHEGWIDVESAVGQGSTFRLYFPAWSRAEEPAAAATQAQLERGGSETLLFVEDDASLRQFGTLLLQKLGYNVLQAGSAGEALRIWSRQRAAISLLLTDVVLPAGMNGVEMAEILCQQKPSLKVIISSGYQADAVRGLDPGKRQRFGFLAKPYDAAALGRTVRQWLDQA